MRYWCTTHWPLREGETRIPSIWVKEENLDVVEDLAVGDLVLLYETATGPTLVKLSTNGQTRHLPCARGKQGVIAVWEVTALCHPPMINDQEYEDGTTRRWCCVAKAKEIGTGYVPRPLAARLLGHNPSYVFRAYGARHSGIKEIGKSEFTAIRQALTR